jgi:hypothetical protein
MILEIPPQQVNSAIQSKSGIFPAPAPMTTVYGGKVYGAAKKKSRAMKTLPEIAK